MNRQRYLDLERHEACLLTDSEIEEGWHFCEEWEFKLIGPGMQELRCCDCPCAAEAKKEVIKEVWNQKLERRMNIKLKSEDLTASPGSLGSFGESINFYHDILEASFNNEPQW
jgi:hypothetical protein